MVLLHGWGLNQSIWTPILDHLTAHYRVWTLDLPGFGESGWAATDADFSQACARVADRLQGEITEPYVLAGWSMGGLIATQIALQQPQRIHSLVTIASSPYFLQSENWPGIKASVLEEFQRQLSTDLHKTIERFLAVQALGSPQARAEIKTMRSLLASKPAPHAEALKAGLEWLARVDLRQQLQHLQVPSIRLYGRRDSLVPAQVADHLQATLKNSADRSHIFTDSAHAPFMTEPDNFAAQIIAADSPTR
nr:pimeloyl-ACP methyl ester esterase BioH [Aliidiomarina indica]